MTELDKVIESFKKSIEIADGETVTISIAIAKKVLDALCNYKLELERQIIDCKAAIERAKFEILQSELNINPCIIN